MKLVIGIVLCVLSTVLGVSFSKKYEKRLEFINGYTEFNKNLKNNVAFLSETLSNIIEKLNNNLFNDFVKQNINNIGKKQLEFPSILSDDEKTYISTYFETVVKSDKVVLSDFLALNNDKLSEKQKIIEEEYKKYKPLCVKLGFLFGLIILILCL